MVKRLICEIDKCLACRSCELACAMEHSRSKTLVGAMREAPLPVRRVRVLALAGPRPGQASAGFPLHCQHCEEPECVYACKSGALTRDPATGAVACDEARCVGCWMCVMACPWGVVHTSARGVALKCDLCADRDEPACVQACPTRALRWEEAAEFPRPSVPDSSRGLRHLIVGASAAGVAAAEAIREVDESAHIAVISEEADPLYSRPMLYLDLMELREDLRFRPVGFFEALGIEPLLGRRAERIDVERKHVRLEGGKWATFDRLLIATGGIPRWPRIPGIEKEGVVGLRTLHDLGVLKRLGSRRPGAVVLGGGNVGLQAASGLRAFGNEVTVIVRSPHLLSQLADEGAGRMFQERLESHGIGVRTGTDVVEILGGERVEGVRLDTGETLPCGIVVPAKGVDANLAVVEGSGIEVGEGIRVNEHMETSEPGVYAAGDVAETVDVVTGRREVHGIWPCAYEQGRIAGLNMAGVARAYDGAMRMNAAEFYGLELMSLGVVKGSGRTEERVRRREPDVYRKLVSADGRLLGALLVGEIRDAGLLRLAIRAKADVSGLEDDLLAGARLEHLLAAFERDAASARDPRIPGFYRDLVERRRRCS